MLRPDTLAMTALLALLTALGPLSTDMYLPSLPAIARDLGASTSQAQLTLSIFLVGFAAGQIVYGPFSDRYGRKPLLVGGLLLFAFASFLCAIAPTIGWLCAARFLQALGASGPIVLARAVVRDLYGGPRAARELSRMGTIMGLVPAAAPVLGGVLHDLFGWPSNFLLCGAIGIAGVAVVLRKLPETLHTPGLASLSPIGILRGFASLSRHRGFLAYLSLMSLTYAGLFSWISASSFILQGQHGLSEIAFGLAFAIGVGGYIAGTILAQRLVPRYGVERTIAIGTVMLAGAGIGMLALVVLDGTRPAEIVLPMALYLCGVGLVMPQAMAGALTPFPKRAGAASSLAGFVQMMTGAAVGAIVGATLGTGPLPLPLAVSATGLASFLIFRLSRDVRARGSVAEEA